MDKIELMVQEIRTLGLPALISFHTVARLGGISAAADHLGMAKSGVSRHVAQIEDHFGVRVLERGARSVRLTPIGQKLDARVRSILAEIELLSDVAREETDGVSGQVTMAATPEFGSLIATELFPELRRRHPDLILVMRTDYAFEDMQDPNTDLAFRVGTFKDDRLVAVTLGGFGRNLVAAPAVVEAYAIQTPSDLTKAPCLTLRGDRPGATWRFTQGGVDETVDVTGPIAVRSFGILHSLAVAGQGFANLPDFMATESLKIGHLVQCLPKYETPVVPVYLTFRPGARQVARIAAVIEAAEELVPDILSPTKD